jgi:hypothetical protein
MDDGTYTVAVRVTDDDGSTDIGTFVVTVDDLGPTAVVTGTTPVDEGTSNNYDASGSTSSPDAIVLYEWDWSYSGTFVVELDTGTTDNADHTYMDDGTYTVAVRVTDDDGSTGIDTFEVIVDDLGPTAGLTGDAVVDEGVSGSYDASSSTSSPDAIVLYEWDWDYNGVTFNPSGDTGVTQSHVWLDDGVYLVAVQVTDDDGDEDIATLSVTVNDLGPTAEAGPDQVTNMGQTIDVVGSGSSSWPDAITLYEWDWTTDGIYDVTGVTATSPAYNTPGIYTVTLRVTDDDLSTDTDTLTVEVLEYHHIAVEPDWNIISIPCYENIDKSDIMVRYGGSDYTWAAAVTANIVLDHIYGWTGATYIGVTTLEPGDGYWMWAYYDCELLIPSNVVGTGDITDLGVQWNIMGLPYSSSLNKANLIVHYDGVDYSWADATSNNNPTGGPLILGFIYGWDETNQIYMLSDDFNPGKGYWMYAYYDVTLKK